MFNFPSPLTFTSGGRLDTDAADLRLFLRVLHSRIPQLRRVVLLGHSTGCQDIVHLLSSHPDIIRKVDKAVATAASADTDTKDGSGVVVAAILQGPVSDRYAGC